MFQAHIPLHPMEWLSRYQSHCHATLAHFFDERYNALETIWAEKQFIEAIRYAVEWSGKRLRVILSMVTYEYMTKTETPDAILRSLLGLEMIHAYTLVHDDLPSMDNDTLRRGKPTVWKQYGETMAILVGDALQTLGFEMLAMSGQSRVLSEITHALWDLWVVRGQIRDTLIDQNLLPLDWLLELHDMKTGGFIASSLVVGAMLAWARDKDILQFREYGFLLGRAFQVRDDILDYEWDASVIGKNTNKDEKNHKGIVARIGIEWSRALLQELKESILLLCDNFVDPRFREIGEYVVMREK